MLIVEGMCRLSVACCKVCFLTRGRGFGINFMPSRLRLWWDPEVEQRHCHLLVGRGENRSCERLACLRRSSGRYVKIIMGRHYLIEQFRLPDIPQMYSAAEVSSRQITCRSTAPFSLHHSAIWILHKRRHCKANCTGGRGSSGKAEFAFATNVGIVSGTYHYFDLLPPR
jgi:hypothetical protein